MQSVDRTNPLSSKDKIATLSSCPKQPGHPYKKLYICYPFPECGNLFEKDSQRLFKNAVYTKQSQKDAKKLASSNLKDKAQALLDILQSDPFQNPPPYEKLLGDLEGAYSRRINIQHRLVYEVIELSNTVKVLRVWTHYE
jgi:toxin YoeB